MAMHESFLRHRRWRYLKASVALCAAAVAAYAWHAPLDGPNGGTWLGYGLGTLGAALIVWLTWLGVRKRQYASTLGTVRGWVSAHVYLGLSLLVIATLHTGFRFGWDIHTLTFALMLLVIASGVYGIAAYARYPGMITRQRAQASREAWLEEVLDLNERAIQLADQISPKVHRFVLESAEQMTLGGGWRAQVFGSRISPGAAELNAVTDLLRVRLEAKEQEKEAEAEQVILLTETSITTSERDPVIERYKRLVEVLTRRNELALRLNRDVQMHARMQIWLYLHVPLSFALLAALAAHVVTVFLYR